MPVKIIITGKTGYIANKVKAKLLSEQRKYDVVMLGVRDEHWKGEDFSDACTVVHTASIVHSPGVKDWETYKKVNVELTLELAKKAKAEKVGLFVFFSSMAVYGVEKELKANYISKDTPLKPISLYGRSKLLAEEGLRLLEDESFRVAVIRPPIVYGRGCSGNYFRKLSLVAGLLPAIPDVYRDVWQGFLCVDNLVELVRLIIENRRSGYYMPQDGECICATELLLLIAETKGRKKEYSRLGGVLVRSAWWLPQIRKVWGGVAYTRALTECFSGAYRVVSLNDGIRKMIGG